MVIKIKMKSKVFILLLGKRAKYAPRIPATAPDAPSIGMEPPGSIEYWVKPAAIPDNK